MSLGILDQCIYITYSDKMKRTTVHKLNGETAEYNGKPVKLINECLLSVGSSYEGRIQSFRSVTGARQKACVLISEISQLMLIPTVSPTSNDCIWIGKDYVLDFKVHKAGESTEVIFTNGKSTVFQVERRVIKTQFDRCDKYIRSITENLKLIKSPCIHLININSIKI